jgi:hypothetical protein
MSGRQLRIVPCNGNRAYKYYLDGYKVNGKRKRLSSSTTRPPAVEISQNLPGRKKGGRGQDGLDVSLDLRSCQFSDASSQSRRSEPSIVRQCGTKRIELRFALEVPGGVEIADVSCTETPALTTALS